MSDRNTGRIIGTCEYSSNPIRKPTMYDMARRRERAALIERLKRLVAKDTKA